MKKIMFMIVLCAFVSISSSAFAAIVEILPAGTQMRLALFQPSADVTVFAEATVVAYTVATKHIGGDIVFQSNSITPGLNEVTEATSGVGKGDPITAANCAALP